MSLGALIIETSINHLQLKKVDFHIPKKTKISFDCSDDIWMKIAEYIKKKFSFANIKIYIL